MSSVSVYDLVGVGFGPANLALSGALIDKWDDTSSNVPRKVLFLEKQDSFRWHPGMLLPHARMQISFMKDLATLRDPRSPITFLNYLHAHDRLLQFINRGSSTPSRREYADYLGWVSRYVQERGVEARFSAEVVALTSGEDGLAEVSYRDTQTGETHLVRAKNLVISPGGRARIPAALSTVLPHPRILHSSAYATSIGAILSRLATRPLPLRIAVIGAGQSGAEVLMDLYERLADIAPNSLGGRHQLDLLFRKGSLKPSDDSPFANEIFDPASTDLMFDLPSTRARRHVVEEYKNTNYGVANARTIDNLYEIMYAQGLDDDIAAREGTVLTKPAIKLHPYTAIGTAASAGDDAPIELTLQDVLTRHPARQASYDLIVYATGYDRTGWLEMLANSGLGAHFGLERKVRPRDVEIVPVHEREVRGAEAHVSSVSSPRSSSLGSTPSTPPSELGISLEDPIVGNKLYVSRSYRVLPVDDAPAPRVYLQGCLESTHGLSDTLLSVMGVKAGEIVQDLAQH
ncbi:hypothetical protein PENSPDRAFT_665177 [Peniophora sp. CONT]|nr:hypothetical protein PENSPDRAFT_665177 [Peniophora sp. CONT]